MFSEIGEKLELVFSENLGKRKKNLEIIALWCLIGSAIALGYLHLDNLLLSRWGLYTTATFGFSLLTYILARRGRHFLASSFLNIITVAFFVFLGLMGKPDLAYLVLFSISVSIFSYFITSRQLIQYIVFLSFVFLAFVFYRMFFPGYSWDLEINLVQKVFFTILSIGVYAGGVLGFVNILDLLIYGAEEIRKKQAMEIRAATQQEFLSRMSHDLRTPLNSILGLSDQLLRQDPDPKRKHSYTTILESSYRLKGLVDNLLAQSLLERGSLEKTESEYDFILELEKTKAAFELQAQSKNLDFFWQQDTRIPPRVFCDWPKIQLVLSGLLSNALKYTEDGRIDVLIGYQLQDSQGTFVFSVRDTGPGISDQEKTQIFEEFTRGDAGEDVLWGLGMGLKICRDFAGVLEGALILNQELQEGSEFVFQVPVQEVQEEKRELIPEPLEKLGHGKKALVLDDEQINCFYMKSLLGELGFEVETFQSSPDFLEIYPDLDVDICFVDLQMPEVDGHGVLLDIRQNRPELPVIILSAFVDSSAIEQSLKEGACGYVTKPLVLSALKKQIRKCLDKRLKS